MENEKVRLTADQAKELSDKKAATIDSIMELIKNQAEYGQCQCFVQGFLKPDLIHDVMQAGYSMKESKDPMGMNQTIISW